MTDEMIALARRAVACRGWRWMPGMLTGDTEAEALVAALEAAPCGR